MKSGERLNQATLLSARTRSARQNAVANVAATSIFATLCRPDHAGMEFTSST